MGITFVCSLRDAGLKALSILVSYKMWILAAGTWLCYIGVVSEMYWFLLSVLIISARSFEKVIGIGFTGRTSAGRSSSARTGTDQGAGEES